MAKDIVVRDSDYMPAYLDGVRRIRTELQSGGLQNWVPEDELFDVAEKKITKNGVYVAAEDNVEGYSVVTVDVEGGESVGTPGRIADVISRDYDGIAVCTYSLGEIHFNQAMPPTVIASNTFAEIPTDCKIYVPAGSLEAYKSASNYPDPTIYTYIEE